jgi:hypothetical protein
MNRYSIRNDDQGPWISLPNNGGELGDMADTVCELNKLITDAELARFERDEAIRILRVLKSDVDHIGHWLPDPCRKMVESFLLENAKEHPTAEAP